MKVYCIGIGGIGLSALARYYRHKGYEVLGSDAQESSIIESLRKEGCDIITGEDASRVTEDIHIVVYTIAIPSDQSELAKAKSLGLRCLTYPEALGEITQEKTTIAVSGTHGKTTTTAMVYSALKACGVSPTVIVGSLLAEHGTNFVPGDSEYLVVEACEYKRSFLNLSPRHVIVTNIDADHLDYYKDINDIKEAFASFAEKVKEGGLVVTHDDVQLAVRGEHLVTKREEAGTVTLSVLGEHNKRNALLVLTLLRKLGFDEEKIREGLRRFPGTWRRLEYKGVTKYGVPVYDDYGHHPEELRVTFSALRERYPRDTYKLYVFFQPHLHSRTKLLFNEFVRSLKDVDKVFIFPIYQARKEDTTVVSEEELAEALRVHQVETVILKDLASCKEEILAITDSSIVVLNIGAGDAYKEIDILPLTK